MVGKTPDHMAGINNAVPKFVYNKNSYDRNSYAAYAKERAERGRAALAKAQADLKRTMADVAKVITDKAHEIGGNSELVAERESSCFENLEWSPTDNEGNGIVRGTFWHGPGDRTYEGELTFEEWNAWAGDDETSLGSHYNAMPKPF